MKELESFQRERKEAKDILIDKLCKAEECLTGYVEMQYEDVADKDIEDILVKVGDTYTVVKGIGIAKDIDPELKIPNHTVWLMHCDKNIRIHKHKHPNIEYFLVIKGQIEVYYYVDNVKKLVATVNSGDSYFIIEQKLHSIKFTEDTSFVIVWNPKL